MWGRASSCCKCARLQGCCCGQLTSKRESWRCREMKRWRTMRRGRRSITNEQLSAEREQLRERSYCAANNSKACMASSRQAGRLLGLYTHCRQDIFSRLG